MKVYHVCGPKKLAAYQRAGRIKGPVRAWADIFEAVRFSISTGRPIILRLHFPDDAMRLPGHGGNAVYLDADFPLPESLIAGRSDDVIADPPLYLRVRVEDCLRADTMSIPLSRLPLLWHDSYCRVHLEIGKVKARIAECPTPEMCVALEAAIIREISTQRSACPDDGIIDVDKIVVSKLPELLSDVSAVCSVHEEVDA